ncbi:ThiF family adenylyltransferase [uncultured Desulfuromusa sp.]|uniref:ThiF family adenylyltransferase n=1 Tax=uncultured Desulfuromusa sp. TaxID=219183 RepID=UPI002AA6B559|nr:ThiF family adenylyltransferase [uncultured Desulfuromusa sp.]
MNRKSYLAPQFKSLLLIGTGGTGSYLAQGLAKLVAGYRLDLQVLLVDPDMVEEKNCARQNFHAWEIGSGKSEALCQRLNQQYGVDFAFSKSRGEVHLHFVYDRLIVSCVDNIRSRKACKAHSPWLDLGNGQETGQAIFGTTEEQNKLKQEIESWDSTPYVGCLPSPYRVANMGRLKTRKSAPSCADHPFAEQGIFANEWAAQAGLAILHQLLVKGELITPHIYFDTAKGRMTSGFVTRDLFG